VNCGASSATVTRCAAVDDGRVGSRRPPGWPRQQNQAGMRRSVFALVLVSHAAGRRSLSAAANAVIERYVPMRRHALLFDAAAIHSWLHPDFVALLQTVDAAEAADAAGSVRSFVTQEADDVYSFPLLSDRACEHLIEEVEHFQSTGLPARRPNSMNNYGVVLNEIGLKPTLSALQAAVHPLARALFPLEGAAFDDHHSFIVSYRPHEDAGLDMHTDDSDVTLNVCLGKAGFEAAGLTFCGDMGAPDHRHVSHRYSHSRGRAVMHLGRRRHGADDITKGHRMNLIMWNWNHAYRASEEYRTRSYTAEASAPDALCVSYTHDRDYEAVVGEARPASARDDGKPIDFGTSAWCPPPQAEYDGFEGRSGRYKQRLPGSQLF